MEAYFSAHPLKSFIPYSRQHVLILFIMLVGIFFLYQYQDLLRQSEWNITVRYAIAFLFIGSEIGLYMWEWKAGIFELATSLPFELCTISLLLASIMIVTKSYRIYEIVFLQELLVHHKPF